MIVLDTNVVSDMVAVTGSPVVRRWFAGQDLARLYITATVMAELLLGIATMPDGRRRDGLGKAIEQLIDKRLAGRILPFDAASAVAYAHIVAGARSNGRAISVSDGQIAAVAALHRFTVATRDTAPFLAAGVPVIDPWQHT